MVSFLLFLGDINVTNNGSWLMLKQGNIDKIWQIVATVTGDKETERVVVSPLFY